MSARFVRTIPILPVRDIAEATQWYQQALDFRTVYLHEGDEPGEATNYAIVARDDVVVHLLLDEPPPHAAAWTKAGVGRLYLLVDDIDAVHAAVMARGVPIARQLQRENWGPRALDLADPSGNSIHIEQAE